MPKYTKSYILYPVAGSTVLKTGLRGETIVTTIDFLLLRLTLDTNERKKMLVIYIQRTDPNLSTIVYTSNLISPHLP